MCKDKENLRSTPHARGTNRAASLLVHLLYLRRVVPVDDRTFDLQRIRQFAPLHAERLGQEREILHLLVVCQLLLQGVDALAVERHDLRMAEQLLHRLVNDAAPCRKLAHQVVDGHDECRDVLVAVRDDGYLVDVTVHHEAALDRLGSDVLAVGRFDQVLQTVGQEQLAVLEVAHVARVEPAVGIDGLACQFLLPVVAARDGLAAQEYLVVFSQLHLHVGHHRAHRADGVTRQGVTGHRGGRLRQSVACQHGNAHRVNELLDHRGDGGTGCGEQVAVLDAQRLLQQTVARAVVEALTLTQEEGGLLLHPHIVQVVTPSHPQGVAENHPAQEVARGNLLLHARVDLLPETRDGTHGRRAHLADGLLDVRRTQVDAHRAATVDAKVGPRLLEDVGQGEEVHHHVRVRQLGQTNVMDTERLRVAGVVEHDALRLARGPGRIEDVCQVFFADVVPAAFQLGSDSRVGAQCQELVEVERQRVLRMADDLAVEDDHTLQRGARLRHLAGDVVLVLLADEQEAYAGILQDVAHLLGGAGGIERDGHRTHAERGKVHVQALGFVL